MESKLLSYADVCEKFGEDFARAYYALVKLGMYISNDKVRIYVNIKEL